MAFLWGGSKSLSELAGKFGWTSVIVSIILTPFLLLWSNLLAYPKWLMWLIGVDANECFEDDSFFTGFRIEYEGQTNAWCRELYTNDKNPGRSLVGWNVYADDDGGKFFESFFGIIQTLDLEEIETDDNRKIWILTPNEWSWFPAKVTIDFYDDDEHSVVIRIPVKGINMYNPFFLMTKWFVLASLYVAKVWGYKDFKKDLGASSSSIGDPTESDDDSSHDDFMYNPFILMTKWFVLASLYVAKVWGYKKSKTDMGVSSPSIGNFTKSDDDSSDDDFSVQKESV